MTDFAGRRILVIGLGREGASLARWLASRDARVTVTDDAGAEWLAPRVAALAGLPIECVLGGHHPELVGDTDHVFVSPGVPESNPVYQAALSAGFPIQSMTTLFFDLCPGRVLGVTGSSGKTTTTGLIGHILRRAGRDVVVGGNIGEPMLDLLPHIAADTLVVLELSSFQLDLLRRSPHIAVVTNISPNHLDRHGTMTAYIAAKRHIVQHQTPADFAVLNASDPAMPDFRDATPAAIRYFGGEPVENGASVQDDAVGLVTDGRFEPVLSTDAVPLRGDHNVENVLAALAATAIVGVDPTTMASAVASFQPAPHRLQTVARIAGVDYVDDSIATSPARAAMALRAINSPIVLIAGGRDKHLPWEEFAYLVASRARALFLIGEASDLIADAVLQAVQASPEAALRPDAVRRCESLEAAVQAARRMAEPGDTVLLSPGCTSFDMFNNFEERGAVFARAVEDLRAA